MKSIRTIRPERIVLVRLLRSAVITKRTRLHLREDIRRRSVLRRWLAESRVEARGLRLDTSSEATLLNKRWEWRDRRRGLRRAEARVKTSGLGLQLRLEPSRLRLETGLVRLETGWLRLQAWLEALRLETGRLRLEAGRVETGGVGLEAGRLGLETGRLGLETGRLRLKAGRRCGNEAAEAGLRRYQRLQKTLVLGDGRQRAARTIQRR